MTAVYVLIADAVALVAATAVYVLNVVAISKTAAVVLVTHTAVYVIHIAAQPAGALLPSASVGQIDNSALKAGDAVPMHILAVQMTDATLVVEAVPLVVFLEVRAAVLVAAALPVVCTAVLTGVVPVVDPVA